MLLASSVRAGCWQSYTRPSRLLLMFAPRRVAPMSAGGVPSLIIHASAAVRYYAFGTAIPNTNQNSIRHGWSTSAAQWWKEIPAMRPE